MKKLLTVFVLMSAAFAANAQNMYDALNFSENNYTGSARTMGLNNAVTALGSDLGTVGINPAGSAVSPFSQFTISTAMNHASNSSVFFDDNDRKFSSTSSRNRISMPNIGLSYTWENYRNNALKRMTFGFISNTTSVYLDRVSAMGAGDATSMFGAFASLAESLNCDPALLDRSGAYYDTNYPWNYITAFQSGQISEFGGGHYAGVTEQIYQESDGSYVLSTAGMLDRNYLRKVHGSKYDMVLNFGMDISDILFLGVNLGLPTANYKFYENYREEAKDPSDFTFEYDNGEKVSFLNAKNEYAYSASMSGAYLKFGVIVLPFAGLRLGAALQTPTLFDIDERYQISGTTEFDNGKNVATSPEGEYSYYLKAPARFNAGVAYTFSRFALISADYEFCDYSTMKYSSVETGGIGDSPEFSAVNDEIKEYAGVSDMFRVGIEVKPVQNLAFRAGYAIAAKNTGGKKTQTNSLSFGVGYTSESSFFFDAAMRSTSYPVSYYTPYSYSDSQDILTPMISLKRNLWEAVATFGWRF